MRFVAQVEDVTERRAVDARVRESERRFRLLVQGVTDYAIYMLSPERRDRELECGRGAHQGLRRARGARPAYSLFFTAEDRATGKPERALETARATGRFADEGWRLRKDGSRFWALAVIDAIRDERGELVGFAKITRDLTERRREEQLHEAQALLAAFTDNSPAAMSLKDREGRYRFVNAKFLEALRAALASRSSAARTPSSSRVRRRSRSPRTTCAC